MSTRERVLDLIEYVKAGRIVKRERFFHDPASVGEASEVTEVA